MDDKRVGLLNLKAALNFPKCAALPTRRSDQEDCCRWEGVERNIINTTWVAGLRLSVKDYGLIWPWSLDASVFLPVEELQVLDLSWNNVLAGPV
ncbi:hypothetical protein CDL15_Pgr015369 [Punica granatum]|uniref:Leucine-rich repeat-containing N-terminal plant-type domain-containing protein n=1 Tax=Punica granatum TaxID=22663 RepID=A0A218VZE3_PUNGR|nr:hypothetical protein CDL15_Pgr015369 [Punica granatum]PKI72709.1 hypothetical protein CRG98_006917 [Punica granatum]